MHMLLSVCDVCVCVCVCVHMCNKNKPSEESGVFFIVIMAW